MGLTIAERREPDELPEAGELVPVEAIDRTGLIVRSDGAFVRILRVTPANPLVLSADDARRAATGFATTLEKLRAGQSMQFYVDARPVHLDDVLLRLREEVEAVAGPAPTATTSVAAGSLSRWRLYAAVEQSLRMHGRGQSAIQLDAYAIIPYFPARRGARAALKLASSAPLERPLAEHRRAVRESQGHVDAIHAELEAAGLPTRQLNGSEALTLLWQRLNPTTADRRRDGLSTEILGECDPVRDREQARGAATALRERLAQSSLDLKRGRHLVEVGQDVEQTIYVHTTAQQTALGWLLEAMLTRQPFALSVHVRALDRRRERQRFKLGHRRLFAINRGAEQRGRVPDFDRYAQEDEYRDLLTEMAGRERARLFEVSVYQALRAPGPKPDLEALDEAVAYCADAMETAVDCKVGRGEFRQRELWASTLPLGQDVARRVRKYTTTNAADTVPLVGTGCGSPHGFPFAFADPGRTLERLDPFDREHPNHTLLISGRSGSGKTMLANMILARLVTLGARGFVIDRAGHYQLLTRMIDGAQQIELGVAQSPYAINAWDVPDPRHVPSDKVAYLLALHQLMMGEEGLTRSELAQLGEAIRAVYARSATLEDQSPCESMLRDELLATASFHQREGGHELASVARSLATRLSEWCGDGSYAYLLDRPTTVPHDSPLVVFDTRRCPQDVLRPVMFSIMEYVTNTVERHWNAYHSTEHAGSEPRFAGRSIMLIDEAWHLVSRRETGEYANDLALRARHFGLVLAVMFQQLSQANTEHGLALLQNATMQLLLAQHPSELDFTQSALMLSDEERELVARLKTVKGSHAEMLWINGTRGRGRVSARVGPLEYWAFTSDRGHDVPQREAALRVHGGDVWSALHSLASSDASPPLA
ncbi:hypothetical protein C8N24_0639 [Solirubrobacter pauli]|uniref:AAA+ ATPase domain-containing protein n=1 Tax=Solirubrobacter pauli TaxID=166793 RepID=A0A660LCQ3_9ACTN|nr:hypothetical protein [Solirubrobacter pauli]RKQ90824.1 hypothetical protein C8N24_0639 [Solirubrobacter pauli]